MRTGKALCAAHRVGLHEAGTSQGPAGSADGPHQAGPWMPAAMAVEWQMCCLGDWAWGRGRALPCEENSPNTGTGPS